MEHKKFTIFSEESGIKVFDFLKGKLKGALSNRKIKEAIDLGGCRINGKVERYGNVVLKAGDRVEFNERKQRYLTFEQSRILFENDDFLAYNKPAGLVCGESGLSVLRQYNAKLEFVHRLDRWTTGVLILAKNPRSKKSIEDLFRNREVEKSYLAVVVGKIEKKSGVIKSRIGKIEEGKWGEIPGGRYAETGWRLIEQKEKTAIIECRPKTGRTHQIRVHMASIGHPILGDDRYGQKGRVVKNYPEHYLLHAWRIKFKEIKIEAPVPWLVAEF